MGPETLKASTSNGSKHRRHHRSSKKEGSSKGGSTRSSSTKGSRESREERSSRKEKRGDKERSEKKRSHKRRMIVSGMPDTSQPRKFEEKVIVDKHSFESMKRKMRRSKSTPHGDKKRPSKIKMLGAAPATGVSDSSIISPRQRGAAPLANLSMLALSPSGLLSTRVNSSTQLAGVDPEVQESLHSDVPRSFMSDEGVELKVGDGIITFERPDGSRMIYGGRMDRIVETLLQWISTEPNRSAVFKLVNIFISCYRRFHTPTEVLDVLIAHWYSRAPVDPNVDALQNQVRHEVKARSAVTMFLGEWFDVQYSDLVEGSALRRFDDFMRGLDETYRDALLAKLAQMKNRAMTPLPPIQLVAPSKKKSMDLSPGKFGFLDLKPEQIAAQWTLLDLRNFMAISRKDFLQRTSPNSSAGVLRSPPSQGTLRPDKDESPWDRMLRRAAMFSRWVASEIVQHDADQPQRVDVMKRWILVALAFLEYKNFNGLMSVWYFSTRTLSVS